VFTRTGSGRTEGKTQEKDDLFVSQALTQKQNEQYDQFASLLEKQAAQSSQRVKEFQDQGQVEAAAVRQNQLAGSWGDILTFVPSLSWSKQKRPDDRMRSILILVCKSLLSPALCCCCFHQAARANYDMDRLSLQRLAEYRANCVTKLPKDKTQRECVHPSQPSIHPSIHPSSQPATQPATQPSTKAYTSSGHIYPHIIT